MNTDMIIYDKGDAYVGSMIGSSGATGLIFHIKLHIPKQTKTVGQLEPLYVSSGVLSVIEA